MQTGAPRQEEMSVKEHLKQLSDEDKVKAARSHNVDNETRDFKSIGKI